MDVIFLNDLELDKTAKIVDIDCNGLERRRFLDLGIIKDTIIKPIFKSPFCDPIAYEIRKTVIALRTESAMKIKVVEI